MERAERLETLLENADIKQSDLASAAGVTDGYISQIMTGRKPPTDKILLAAEVLFMRKLGRNMMERGSELMAYAKMREPDGTGEEETHER